MRLRVLIIHQLPLHPQFIPHIQRTPLIFKYIFFSFLKVKIESFPIITNSPSSKQNAFHCSRARITGIPPQKLIKTSCKKMNEKPSNLRKIRWTQKIYSTKCEALKRKSNLDEILQKYTTWTVRFLLYTFICLIDRKFCAEKTKLLESRNRCKEAKSGVAGPERIYHRVGAPIERGLAFFMKWGKLPSNYDAYSEIPQQYYCHFGTNYLLHYYYYYYFTFTSSFVIIGEDMNSVNSICGQYIYFNFVLIGLLLL